MSCKILSIFFLLVWKNFQKQKSNKLVLLLSLVLPVLFSLFFLFIRLSNDKQTTSNSSKADSNELELTWSSLLDKINGRRAEMVKKQKNFERNVFIPQIKVAYAPSSTAGIQKLMASALTKLSIPKDKIVEFENCNDLRTHASSEHFLASVCFRNVDEARNGLPSVLDFAIRMPSELRSYEATWIGDSWKELPSFANHKSSGEEKGEDGGDTDYLREGFVALQYHICAEYLQTASKTDKLPKVSLRPLNADSKTNALFSNEVTTSGILLILLGFMFPVSVLIKLIVEERELGQRRLLESNNASVAVQILAWMFNVFCQLLMASILITFIFKIEWNGMVAFFNNCPWQILLLFLVSYVFSVTGFVVFMSSLISSTKNALFMAPILWLLVPLPFISEEEVMSQIPHVFYSVATIVLCNVSVSRGLRKLFYMEDHPMQGPFTKFLMSKVTESDYGLLFPIGCFYVQALFCFLFALILENDVWSWLADLYKKSCRACRRTRLFFSKIQKEERKSGVEQSTKTMEETQASIYIHNVWKRLSNRFAVENVTVTVYPGEVVALLGKNASGKKTLLRLVKGLTRPNSGEVFVSGFNVQADKMKAIKFSGMSMSSKPEFSEFTVYEYLTFLCQLRGLGKSEAKDEVKSYLRFLKIEESQKTQVYELSKGQKLVVRTLGAFVGKTTIIVLNKPFDGVDDAKARLLFSFIQKQKSGRSIFYSTSSSRVAGAFADRIAIFSDGKILSIGTKKTLCRKFNDSYRLTLFGKEKCDFKEVHLFLQNYIANIELDSVLGDSAVFLVNNKNQQELGDLLENLTKFKEDLNVFSFQLEECSFQQVVDKMFSQEQSKSNIDDLEFRKLPIKNRSKCRFFKLSHFRAVIRLRLIADIRISFLALLKFILPALVAIWALSMPYFWDNSQPPGNVVFPIPDHGDRIILIQQKSPSGSVLKAAKEYAEMGATEVKSNMEISKYIRQYILDQNVLLDMDFLAAAIFFDGEVTALFNNKWHHAAPESLALVMHSLAIGLIGSESGIKVELDPLPFSTVHTLQLHLNANGVNLMFVICLSFSFCFIWSIPLLYMSLHRDSRYNYIELIAGIRLGVLILAFLVYDLVFVLLALLPLLIVFTLLQWDVLMDAHIFLLYTYVLFVVAFCVLSLNILISIGFSELRYGYLVVLLFYSFGIVIYMAVHQLQPVVDPEMLLLLFLDFHPFYALSHNLMRILGLSQKTWLCSDKGIYETSVYAEKCKRVPNCCDSSGQEFHYLLYLCCVYLLSVVVWISILILLKTQLAKGRSRQGKYVWENDPDCKYDQNLLHITQPNELENTWILEKSRVRTLERSYIKSKVLHVEHLSVSFGVKRALKHVDFMMNRYQVLSIFGANGTGKTVLLETILGIHSPNAGRIIGPNKVPFKSGSLESCTLIGYSAQELKSFQYLTVMESIKLILRVQSSSRGKRLKRNANKLCKALGLYEDRFNLLSICSQGILKRLSIGIALMSNADLILLDDPFTALDVVSQRSMLHLIHNLCRKGNSVIYTCTDPEFSSSALRMAVISHPGIAAIGERQEIQRNYYSSYFMIETRIHMPEWTSPVHLDSDDEKGNRIEKVHKLKPQPHSNQELYTEEEFKYLRICGLIERIFPHAIIKNVDFPMACFWLSSNMYSLKQIVRTLYANKQHFYSYSISQPTVSSIFLTISTQKTPRETLSYDVVK
ncbi:ATP-binding cassette sub-family A member 6 [Drosophila ficusphila]|uniref:ATP-binding cassette sub-family A member 6 n=1 Tax=Drosophila ficusphila TaxID=30025 RepID=UPI001C8AFE55|nr:ATP-binding cassette sub-family A member 6 [Drosophila ficusphila]